MHGSVRQTAEPQDPWEIFTASPANETQTERAARLQREQDEQRVSNVIDEAIKNDRMKLKKDKECLKILLAGQSDSGKSSTLKNFQLKYAPDVWERERSKWRSVIQLNLIGNVLAVVGAVQDEMAGELIPATHLDEAKSAYPLVQFPDKYQLLLLRLGPLRQVESELRRRLAIGSEHIRTTSPLRRSPLYLDDSSVVDSKEYRKYEFAVRSWQDALDSMGNKSTTTSETAHSEILSACCADMENLWGDETVQVTLRKRGIDLRNSSGFFLDDIKRITSRSYEPTDADILRARLRTIGVQEYRLTFNQAPFGIPGQGQFGREWILYDVGGATTQRAAWLPFFESIHALIFLLPCSSFDERLEEDPKVNRLEDTSHLWNSICSSQLLNKASFILFINKVDLLKSKLKKPGLRIRDHLPSYGSRENDAKSFVVYLQQKFKEKHKHKSQTPRPFYSYLTTVIDTKATANTLKSVRDGIARDHLADASFL